MNPRWLLPLLCLLPSTATAGQLYQPTTYPPVTSSAEGTITLYSTLDTVMFEPLVKDFQRAHPGIGVHYEYINSMPQYEQFIAESNAGIQRADLLISSSMDLQVKLVNDGYAAPYSSPGVNALPSWARWRNEAFGFTFEPAVMVFNREAMEGRAVPRTRTELIEDIRRDPAFWRGRIGTYDISRSSVGYLLASQDARLSGEFGTLMEALGDIELQVEENTSTLLQRIGSGNLVAGYNLLGSYTQAQLDSTERLLVVYPRDHTLVLTRTAVIARNAPNPRLAATFLEYLLSARGQEVMSTQSKLPPIHNEVEGMHERLGVNESQIGVLRPIPLGPGLLVYLDQQKRRRILEAWHGVMGTGNTSEAAGQDINDAP